MPELAEASDWPQVVQRGVLDQYRHVLAHRILVQLVVVPHDYIVDQRVGNRRKLLV